ncbi:peptide chain release factor N(5)-glutamine methyltransferase [Jannaschia ovalis]|uniref:Release factor glutamine methyltransferase n=1 Tax=Jannaschia ovalis TaxID=3038773 RepID=A0ABY8LFV8_9RHOB|nr:peptide chain release factor N(5)-glutamine methyltransferase [Jannaschia sp. GRR-S6-38]WGH79010.1 peptide chain release factor N(5)-glutamine methyltransferase [Jannaschia sp. GRR-S6-38]
MSRRDALARARAALEAAGVPGAARDAEILMRAVAGPVEAPDAAALARFEALVARRAAREPVSHLTGRRAFWRHEFEVTPDVLDPRPETETLVAAALAAPFARLLDLGTGSGCILCSLLAERPEATGLGTDVSDAALAVARRNAAATGVAARAEFSRADWLDGVEGPFDLIVSNPPYIAEDEMAALLPEVLREPRGALTPGGDGLDAYRVIARDAPARLAPGGRLMVEIGPTQGDAVAALFRDAGLAGIAIRPDLDGRDRVVQAEKPR